MNDKEQWLNSVFDESVEFTILDLLQMGKDTRIVVDAFMEPEFLKVISDASRMVYLFAGDDLNRAAIWAVLTDNDMNRSSRITEESGIYPASTRGYRGGCNDIALRTP